jgi:hypothetical protein
MEQLEVQSQVLGRSGAGPAGDELLLRDAVGRRLLLCGRRGSRRGSGWSLRRGGSFKDFKQLDARSPRVSLQ